MRTFEQIRDDARSATLSDVRRASDRLISSEAEYEARVRFMIGPDSVKMRDTDIAAHCTIKCEKLLALAKRGHWTFSTTEYLGWLALRDAANLRLIVRANGELTRHAG
ncbi:hypothetical protein [Methylosinus sporium]|uniref:Uncharacterized protein n=1 Tax=Methylosinus sporium TaxID=428 RepID=A0A2U1SSU6_METSR|nr:hypothetical protein [Methylosinus sporium]PWB94691.1 hypothetical protein C5689_06400 [Methylosinus sporium]